MELENLVVVTGLPGIYRMASNRSNGLIVEDLDTGKKKFVSARQHQFTPLESIAIYTMEDSSELKVVFAKMLEESAANPPVSPKASAQELQDYFRRILPNFDPDRVHVSDIKKVIKWFNFLHERQLLTATKPSDEEE